MKLSDLDLSAGGRGVETSLRHMFKQEGFETVADILALKDWELRCIPNIGKVKMGVLLAAIASVPPNQRGLSFVSWHSGYWGPVTVRAA